MPRYIKSIGDGTQKTRCSEESNKRLRSTGDDDLYNRSPIEEVESLQWMESYMAENGATFGESMSLFNRINESGGAPPVEFCPKHLQFRFINR